MISGSPDAGVEATFTFVDLAGFTALTETHGDDAAASLVVRFYDLIAAAATTDARLVSIVGDGAFLVSDDPASAVRMVERLVELARVEPNFPELRAGLHHGRAAERSGQFYGTAVNIAARIAGYARGGQVLCSSTIVPSINGALVHSIGLVAMKNLREPIELFVLAFPAADASVPIDPVCRMRVERSRAGAHLELAGSEYWFCSRECLRIFLSDRT